MRLEMAWGPMLRRAGPPRGLKNLGNTCYLNSVLQCLAHTPPFVQFCLASHHSSLCSTVVANRDKECGFCIIERQVARLHTAAQNGMISAVDSPVKVVKCLSVFSEHFKWGRQEDAHEFLRYVVDTCHTTSARLAKARTPAGSHNGLVAKSTIVSDIFGGAVLSQVKCMSCNGESNKTDEIMDLSLDVCLSNSVKDALARFFKPEVLDGNNKYSCDRCKKLSVARKQMFMSKAPNVLVIQLKRFEGLLGGKINRNIEFEEHLLLSSYMFDGAKDSHPEYSLFGSIVHSGYSMDSGHYYAYIKDASGNWYCCNDTQISRSNIQEVLSEKVYMLFYMLKNPNNPNKPNKITKNGYTNGGTTAPIKPSHSNGTEISKPPLMKQNVVCTITKTNGTITPNPSINHTGTTKTNGTITPNPSINHAGTSKTNGTIIPNPSIKQIGKVKFEIKKPISSINGTSKPEFKNNGTLIKKNNQNKVSLSPSNSGSSGEPKSINKGKAPISNGSNNTITNGRVLREISNNGKRDSNPPVNRGTGDLQLSNGKRDPEQNGGVQLTASVSGNGVSHSKGTENLLKRENGSSETAQDSSMWRSYEQLQKLKELLVRDASSDLRSCSWVDEVESYMRNRKRLCVRQQSLDVASLREQLINDSKKMFQSQIPNSLKGNLHHRLLSFYKDKSPSGA